MSAQGLSFDAHTGFTQLTSAPAPSSFHVSTDTLRLHEPSRAHTSEFEPHRDQHISLATHHHNHFISITSISTTSII